MGRQWPVRRLFRFPWRGERQIREDVDDEIRFHLDMRARELADAGMTPEAAREAARREFGDLELARRRLRDIDTSAERRSRLAELGDGLALDLRYAARALRRSPGFTTVAVLTLALGIGANTAIFGVVHSVVLAPLPFAAPERLVRVLGLDQGGGHPPVSPLDFQDFRAGSKSFAALAALSTSPTTITSADREPEQLERASVSASFLPMLGVTPLAGRHFAPRDEVAEPAGEVMLSEQLWRSRFGADLGVVGRTVILDGAAEMVVGIVPAAQRFPATTDVWSPIVIHGSLLEPPLRRVRYLRVYARLAPGATLASARTELQALAKRLAERYPSTNADLSADVVDLQTYLVGDLRRPFFILLGAVGLVLLVACANVANLLLARAAGRAGEIAIRAAIGASRGRVVRQLVTESVLLALLGGALGVLLAVWGTRALASLAADLAFLQQVRVDRAALLATAAVTLVTGVLFGLVPAWQATRADLARSLRDGRRAGRSGASRRARRALVMAEMALSVVLLAGAGLLIRSFVALRAVDPGFRSDGVVTFDLSVRSGRPGQDKAALRRQFVAALLDRLREVPGARAAAVTSGLPLSGATFMYNFRILGRPGTDVANAAEIRAVSPRYFETLGIRLVRGRPLSDADRQGAPPVMVVNEAFARRFLPGVDPLGQRLLIDYTPAGRDGAAIVAVVSDVKQYGLAAEPQPEFYVPFDQGPMGDFSVVVRADRSTASAASAASLLSAARRAVHELDPSLAVQRPRLLDDVIADSAARQRLYTVLLGLFAGAALLLAAVGVYGVVSYTVAQRAHEMGVRMALGARAADIARLVLGEGLGLTAAGLALGLAGALWATRLLRGLLYGVGPGDPVALLAGPAVLLVAGLAACWLPARRAARVDPTVAMRAEG